MSTENGSDQRPLRISTMSTRPAEPEHLPCPRCDSVNTKFCYYNNYNLSQPRHFCKSCRRYWTRGGTLRNVPVGGGSRKSSSSSSGVKRARTNPSSSVVTSTTSSCSHDNMAHHQNEPPLHATPVSMVSQMGAGSGHVTGCDVNLNEAVPEAANFSSFLTTATTQQVGPTGFLSFAGGFGFGNGPGHHGMGFGLGVLDFPMDSVGHGNGSVGEGGGGVGGSSGCNTWQMGGGGGVEGDGGDCFGWPELAMSMPEIKGPKRSERLW